MTLKIYFRTQTAAMAFRAMVGTLVQCSQPRMAPLAREGRSILVTATIARQNFNRGAEARALDRLINTAARYDGIVVNTQNPQEIP